MIQIKKAELFDLESIYNLIKNDPYLNWPHDSLSNELKNNYCLIALQKDNLIGFLSAVIINNYEAQIMAIFVKEEFRYNNIGTLLLKYLTEFACLNNINSIILEVGENNKPAINFYKKNGFEITGERNNYYSKKEKAFILKKLIQSSDP